MDLDPLKQWANVASGRGVAVPDVEQTTNFTCGPAALAGALRYFGKPTPTEGELATLLGTDPGEGTTYEAMVEGAKALGLDAELVEGASVKYLAASLESGELPIVALQAWEDDTAPPPGTYTDELGNEHFVIVVAIDDANMLFEDPAAKGSRVELSIPEFESRWHVVDGGGRVDGLAIILRGDGPTALRAPVLAPPKPMP